MRVRVYVPPFADSSSLDPDGSVTLPEGSTLDDLLRILKVPFRRGAACLCMVNCQKTTVDRRLADADVISFFSLLSGG
ncbi:MAG: MoaD/ThiS family protein [Spirochaetales bacterium]|nr:MAG: MoaD/ThiS family protein [Spirochaetales bacterium]